MQWWLGCVLLVLALAGCNSAHDDLLGEYAVRPDGPPLVRVTRSSSGYAASIRLGPGWSTSLPLAPCQEADYIHQFGPRWRDVEPVGLRARRDDQEAYPFGIFKVRRGAGAGRHRFEGGYFVEFGGAGHGAGNLFRVSTRRPASGAEARNPERDGVRRAL
jgi:hypothetical protein